MIYSKLLSRLLLALTVLCSSPFSFAQTQTDSVVMTSALQKIDVKTGNGAEVKPGDQVEVHYTGWLHDPLEDKEHGAKFDSSVGSTPFTFRVGAGKVIKGWDQGLVGMKVGGKRTLIIPPQLGYGNRGAGPVIGPGASLIFDIELLSIR